MTTGEEIMDNDNLLVIDTDCGSDDAMALLMALDHPSCRVLAITTCFGNTSVDHATSNVFRILTVAGHETIPVFRGSGVPLLPQPTKAELVHGSDGFGGRSHIFPTGDLREEEEPAASALVTLARKHPKTITLVAIGPLINLALAHRMDPAFTENLKAIVVLGGNYKGVGNTTETAEYNFYCDPESAHIVLTESKCPVQLIPWETMEQHGMAWDYYYELMDVPNKKGHFLKNVTSGLAEFHHRECFPMFYDCDILAAATVLCPSCITKTTLSRMVVECRGAYTRGMSVCLKAPLKELPEHREIQIVEEFDNSVLIRLRKEMIYN